EARSRAPETRKADVAAEALRQGLINESFSASDRSVLGRLRQRSMEMIIEYGPAETESVEYLEEIMYRNFDINEQLTAIAVLESDGGAEAVQTLIRFLKVQNERQLSGLTPADHRLIRSTIQSLGAIGDSAGFEELTAVRISNWPSAIVREASDALEKLK
ncbi:MAG: hypothetical protein HN368_18430, partial [Spirochaetales bacterium]|nr:hypothetical protein [Spirochaetales bacterium]